MKHRQKNVKTNIQKHVDNYRELFRTEIKWCYVQMFCTHANFYQALVQMRIS